MKSIHKHIFLVIAASAAMGNAWAAGSHAGGYGDDSEAIGKAGEASNVTRTVKIDMTDNMRYTPANITAKQGETIRFVVTNSGKIKHEMVLGSQKELKEHYEAMKKNPEMEHADPNQVTLAPGGKGEIIWQFTKPGKVDFACLQPGHYDAGMKGKVVVAAAKGQDAKKMHGSEPGSGMPMNHMSDDAPKAVAPAMMSADSHAPAMAVTMTEGEVRRVDKDQGKLTIKHGPLTNLGMPAMTMVFQVKDTAWLDQIKSGDKINFVAEKINGAMTVTKLEPMK